MLRRPSGMAVCRLSRGVLVVDGSRMGVTSTSLVIALSGSFADSLLRGGASCCPESSRRSAASSALLYHLYNLGGYIGNFMIQSSSCA